MKLLDTNVAMYAVGRPHPYKQACVQLLQDVVDGVGDFTVDTELLQEILHVYAARGERARGLVICDRLLRIFSDPFPIARQEIVLARDLLERYPQLVSRDAIHAAVAQSHQLEGIVSADTVFDVIGDLRRFDPLALYPEEQRGD